jgi:acyl-coenzyme A thioesterase PaaI-like protein
MYCFRRKSEASPRIAQLAKNLVADALRLTRVEADLVKARFSAMLRRAGIGAGLVAGGAVMAFLGIVGVLVANGSARTRHTTP